MDSTSVCTEGSVLFADPFTGHVAEELTNLCYAKVETHEQYRIVYNFSSFTMTQWKS